jgi:hypothetical protein
MNVATPVPSGEPEDRGLARLQACHDRLLCGLRGLPGAEELVVAPELARPAGAYGGKPIHAEVRAFRAAGVELVRVVRIDGPGTFILNAVSFSEDDASLPLLGIEVLVFKQRLHLLVADLFPLVPDDDEAVADLAASLDPALGDRLELPAWSRAIFSADPILRKPGSSAALAPAAAIVDEVVGRWEAAVSQRAGTRDPRAPAARRRRDEYVRVHARDEPAIPFLGRVFGTSLATQLVDELLFPRRFYAATENQGHGREVPAAVASTGQA